MLKWFLIFSITIVSATMLMFISQFLAILPEAQQYYDRGQIQILLMSNSFNIMYIIIAPLLFPYLKKYYLIIVSASVALNMIGIVGRYFCAHNYNLALIMTIFVAIAQIPIISAPYGLLDLFDQSKRSYVTSIPLFLPNLGSNISILYGMQYISDQSLQLSKKFGELENLNFIIALLAVISCSLTLAIMYKLRVQINKINEQETQVMNQKNKSNNRAINEQLNRSNKIEMIKILKDQLKGNKHLIIMLTCWGIILGLNWTYGDMFGVFLNSKNVGLSHKQIALVGLFANLSTVVFSNLGNWISDNFNFSNHKIIFNLNFIGFIASLFIVGFVAIENQIIHNKITLIIMIIMMRGGFCSFVSLALIQLEHQGSSVLLSSIFFYIANVANLGCNFLVSTLKNLDSLAIMSIIIITCIIIVHIAQKKRKISIKLQDSGVNELKTSQQKSDQQISTPEILV